MKTYTQVELKEILDKHSKWLRNEPGGERANLSGADLTRAYLSGADLTRAYLTRADLTRADLTRANLSGADLSGADLTRAYLTSTILENKEMVTFQYKKHLASYTGLDEITIGCHKHPIQYWLDNFESIGKANGYAEEEIAKYGRFIKSCARDFKKGLK